MQVSVVFPLPLNLYGAYAQLIEHRQNKFRKFLGNMQVFKTLEALQLCN